MTCFCASCSPGNCTLEAKKDAEFSLLRSREKVEKFVSNSGNPPEKKAVWKLIDVGGMSCGCSSSSASVRPS